MGKKPILTIYAKMRFLESRGIITDARRDAVGSVDFHRVQMYWRLGERIFVEEQRGQERAEYGSYLIKNLASVIEPEFGSGFSVRQLEGASWNAR